MYRLVSVFLAAALVAAAPSAHAAAPAYDVVIAGGRVIDPESGLDGIRNVGVRGGRIAAVSARPLAGRTVVDGKGLVVAPGFIDLHVHTETPLSNGFKALDGVTTALELEMGVFPVDAWYADMAGKARLNYGASVSHMAAHAGAAESEAALGGEIYSAARGMMTSPLARKTAAVQLSDVQLQAMDHLLQRGLDQGALGIGMGIQYVPGARRTEVLRGFEVAARNHVVLFAHARQSSLVEPDSVGALQELLADGRVTGAAFHMMHVNSTGLSQTPILLAMLDEARRHGADATTEAYPYDAGWSNIGSVMLSPGWRTRYGIDYRDIQNMKTGDRFDEKSFERTRADEPDTPVVAHLIPEAVVEAAVAHPGVIIASDSVELGPGMGHPRTAGTYSRVLGRYVRERHLMTLPQALAKMTILPARRLEPSVPEMKRKGRIRVGADADITVFDPATIIDRSTYADPMQASEGVRDVLVNGVFVVRDGRLVEGARPGRPVRRPVKALR
jgi:dihydroorotase